MPEETRFEQRIKLRWPSPQDYNEAVQNPSTAFADEDLRTGVPELDGLGLPRPNSGNFASVYKVAVGDRNYAVRCFLNDVADNKIRYEMISRAIMADELSETVGFEYQHKGIFVGGEWFPILKMDWVDGVTLDRYVEEHLSEPAKLEEVAARFRRLYEALAANGTAHGDLQHGNIMVLPDGQLRLVDYDGMFVPEMAGMRSAELGHRNYQHPKRTAELFNKDLDNFSALVIYASLLALQHADVHAYFNRDNDCLLFSQKDLENPEQSHLVWGLVSLDRKEISDVVQSLLCVATAAPDIYLPLGEAPPFPVELRDLRASRASEDEAAHPSLSILEQTGQEYDVEEVFLQHAKRTCNGAYDELPTWMTALVLGIISFLLGTISFTTGCFCLLVCALIVAVDRRRAKTTQSLVCCGVAVPAIVTQLWTRDQDGNPNFLGVETYCVTYQFLEKTEAGSIRRPGTMELTEAQWNSLRVGDVLTALYDKADPFRSVLYSFCGHTASPPL
jgi:hypothetical protein